MRKFVVTLIQQPTLAPSNSTTSWRYAADSNLPEFNDEIYSQFDNPMMMLTE
jgi:hypothetical protein